MVPLQSVPCSGWTHADACSQRRSFPGSKTQRTQLIRHLLQVVQTRQQHQQLNLLNQGKKKKNLSFCGNCSLTVHLSIERRERSNTVVSSRKVVSSCWAARLSLRASSTSWATTRNILCTARWGSATPSTRTLWIGWAPRWVTRSSVKTCLSPLNQKSHNHFSSD